MAKVLIGGAIYGWHNIGDDGLLRGIINDLSGNDIAVLTKKSKWLKNEFPEVKQFELIQYDKPKYGCWLGNKRKLSSWKNSLFPDMSPYIWGDVLICGGGTIFSACPWHAYRVTKLAERAGKKTIIWGAGMCEETDTKKIKLIKKWCNMNSLLHIYVRDEFVEQRLLKLGVDTNKVSVCYDPAYMLEAVKYNEDKIIDKKARKMYSSNRRKIVLTLSGEADIYSAIDISFFKKLIYDLSSSGYDIFLIPISYSEHTKDQFIAKELSNLNNNHVCYIKEEFQPRELIGFLQNIDICISSRLHMSIYSAIAGIPFISLKRNEKNSDLANLFDMPCYTFDELNANKLKCDIDYLFNNKTVLSNKIKEKVLYYKRMHMKQAIEMNKIIKTN